MSYTEQCSAIKQTIDEADCIVVGAGSGLSTSAGYTYSGERFEKNFSDFIEKYDLPDMYSGGFYEFDSLEEHWAYWSRYIMINRYIDIENDVYSNLLKLVKDKDYFVLTTNVDHCFQKAGFDKNRLFYTQGDYGLFQCSEPCCQETYENENLVKKMYVQQKDMKIPSELIPYCPRCGKPMSMNLRADSTFVQDQGWYKAADRFQEFMERHFYKNVVYLELGVGYNSPGVIKYPFWKYTNENPNARYICINYGEAYAPKEIEDRSICLNGDIAKVLRDM